MTVCGKAIVGCRKEKGRKWEIWDTWNSLRVTSLRLPSLLLLLLQDISQKQRFKQPSKHIICHFRYQQVLVHACGEKHLHHLISRSHRAEKYHSCGQVIPSLQSSIQMMTPSHYSLRLNLHRPTMTAELITFLDVPIMLDRANFAIQPQAGYILVVFVANKRVRWPRKIRTPR